MYYYTSGISSSWVLWVFHKYFCSIITLAAFALKSYSTEGFLDTSAGVFNHFWIQVAVSVAKRPSYKVPVAVLEAKRSQIFNYGITVMCKEQREKVKSSRSGVAVML
jgi:hypothetical protein